MASFNFLKPTPLTLAFILFLQFSMIKGLKVYHEYNIPRDNARDLTLVKIKCLIILFATTFGCGLLPYFYRSNANFLLLGTQFAGGVFLAISMHFLYNSDASGEYSSKFPFLMVLVGYLLAMFGESILFKIKKGGEREADLEVEEGIKVGEESTNRRAAVGVTILLILGLSLQSVYEGIHIGLERLKIFAWRYLWTISIHKVFLAIAMGIAVLRMQPRRPFLTSVAYSFAFAISTPVGIVIALANDEAARWDIADAIINDLLMVIASGVFIYISINHLIAKGVKPQAHPCSYDTPFRKFFAVCTGVVVIIVGMLFDYY